MARLDPQVQFQLAIDPVDALVIPFETLHVAQIQEAQAEAPVALVVSQAYQPVGHDSVFRVELGAIAIAGLTDAKRLAGQSYFGRTLGHGPLRHLPPLRWRYHFFVRASATISAFKRSSAYIFFSRRFSSSSSFMRAISEASIPPNLARHL